MLLTKARSGLYSCFHLSLLQDLESFALCTKLRWLALAHALTASIQFKIIIFPVYAVAVEVISV